MISLPTGLRKVYYLSALVSLVFFILAACTSTIYFHADEHYQIVEFASYKLGITQLHQLPWEFEAHIRSAFQPMLCFGLFKIFNVLHINDHFNHLLLLKLLTGLFSLFAIGIFCLANLPFIGEKYRPYYIMASFLFWYPYMFAVHFSSEAWSANFMLVAISVLLLFNKQNTNSKKMWLFAGIGILLGTAFLCRYQTAIMTVGLFVWLWLVKKENVTALFSLLCGGVLILIFGVLIDHWLYGEWVCTIWSYFDSAFIHKHSDFGSSPFYTYLIGLFVTLSPPIGFAAICALILLFFKQPKSIYTFVLLPFIALHFFIAHKEFRFLFPIMGFLPVVIFLAVDQFINQPPKLKLYTIKFGWRTIVLFNFLYLIVFVFFTARFSSDSKAFCQRMHTIALKHPLTIYYIETNNDPFIVPKATIANDMFPEYLRDKNMKHIMLKNACEIDSLPQNNTILFATNKYELETDTCLQKYRQRLSINCRTTTGLLDKLPIKQWFGTGVSESLDINTCLIMNVAKK